MERLTKCCGAKVHNQNGTMFCPHCVSIVGKHQIYVKGLKPIYAIVFVLLIMLLFTNANAPKSSPNRYNWVPDVSIPFVEKDIELDSASIVNFLYSKHVVLPNVALGQAWFESGRHFDSQIAIENKNILGIKYVHQKLAIGEKNGHAVYKTYKDCLMDWVRINENYLSVVKKHYSTNPAYVESLHKL